MILLEIQEYVQKFRLDPNCPLKAAVDTKSNHYDFFYELARRTQPKIMVEIGTHWGVATAYMHRGCPQAKIFTVDNNLIKSDEVGKFAKNLPNVEFILGEAVDVAEQIPNGIDIIFIDEEKDVPNLRTDLELYYPKLKSGGFMFFDDVLGKDFYPDAYDWWTNLTGYNKLNLSGVHQGYALGAIIKP